MSARDPVTGQFVSADDMPGFDGVEVVTARATFGVTASNNSGSTGFNGEANAFEGIELIDYDDIVDRNESVHLLSAAHALSVFGNSTGTEDGTIQVAAEVSASPSRSAVATTFNGTATTAPDGDDVVGEATDDDSIDIIGRPLYAVAHQPYSDTATGIGGAGSAGLDSYEAGSFPQEFGRFHPRDELFTNGQIRTWNVQDAGVHGQLGVQHLYGVVTDD